MHMLNFQKMQQVHFYATFYCALWKYRKCISLYVVTCNRKRSDLHLTQFSTRINCD